MAKLFISDTALQDLKEIKRFISLDKPIAASRWVSKIRRKCRLLAKSPELGDSRDELGSGIRVSYLGDYCIFFRATDDNVEIVRVIRGDRDIKFL
jgi:toxin ParE1/3/4